MGVNFISVCYKHSIHYSMNFPCMQSDVTWGGYILYISSYVMTGQLEVQSSNNPLTLWVLIL